MTRFTATSPQRPSVALGTYQAHTKADVVDKARRAREAERAWAATPPLEPAATLQAAADALAAAAGRPDELGVAEVGEPVSEMAAEVARGVAIVRYDAQRALAAEGDLERAFRFTNATRVGLARVNGPTAGVDFHLPFGGTKASSLGPGEQGTAARDLYSWTQTAPAP